MKNIAVIGQADELGGVSPLTAITRRQVDGLKARLDADGVDVPVYLGMRNWHPLLPDVLRTMAQDGVRLRLRAAPLVLELRKEPLRSDQRSGSPSPSFSGGS